jgi:hypothetical protein
VVALCVVVLHVLSVVFLGTSPAGSLLGNALQIFSSLLAAAMCFRAAQRAGGFGRSFWTLVGFAMGVWGFADFGWTYYEACTRAPAGVTIEFLFTHMGFFAIFLNQIKRTLE